ncbi:MAG TPA: transposase, partial [Pyrinomonadaceae bacterium]|nr:transposase [Pyrinomonadaceae bacterium]
MADEKLKNQPQHRQAKLAVSEVVTLALLFALKGANTRHFHRWLKRDYLPLFPSLPERTRLFQLFKRYRHLVNEFLADSTILGVTDSFGIEMCHPVREKRFPDRKRLGRKGKSNSRWIVGGKLCVVLNKLGLVCGFQTATANVSDTEFHTLLAEFEK